MTLLKKFKDLEIVVAVGVMVFLSSCARLPSSAPSYGKETEVSRSGDSRPEWIDSPGAFQKSHPEKLWFSGSATKKYDLEEGRQDAYMDAIKSIANRIRLTVRDDFNKARAAVPPQERSLYSTRNEQAIVEAAFSRSRGMITSANADSYWWRKYWMQESPGGPVQYYYDVYCLVSMSRKKYDQTVYQTLEGIDEAFRSPDARSIIRFMEKKYLKDSLPQ